MSKETIRRTEQIFVAGTTLIFCLKLHAWLLTQSWLITLFVCVEVLRPSQPNGVMSSAVSLPNHTFTGQA